MPPKAKITQEMILNTVLELTKGNRVRDRKRKEYRR